MLFNNAHHLQPISYCCIIILKKISYQFKRISENIIKKLFTIHADESFQVEINGSLQSKTAVILIHGFGVTRDSRGMFVEIESCLSDLFMVVRGDFSQVSEKTCRAIPFSAQLQRLRVITDLLQNQYKITKFVYIGHSQGCIVIGKAQPRKSKILLLAPPIVSPFNEFIKTQGWKNSNSHLDLQGSSRLVRSDLIIEVEPEFWEEFQKINAVSLYSELARHNDVKVIFAGMDQVLGKQNIDIPSIIIPNADHDFKSPSRSELLKSIFLELVEES